MDRYLIIPLLLFTIACSTNNPDSTIIAQEVKTSSITNNREWKSYEGILPCADCEGVLTRIHIEDHAESFEGNFNISLIYKKSSHDSTFASSGIYRIRKGLSHLPHKIVYEFYPGDNKRKMFFLQENDSTFLLLDRQLQMISSDHNLRLSLKK